MDQTQLRDLRVAVIGGGYGGAATAIALTRAGVGHVAVYEQARSVRQVGAGIGLRPPTVELFRRWGIFDAVEAVSSPSDHLEILSADGEQVLAQEAWPGLHDYAQPNHTRIIHRGDFIDALFSALPSDAVHIGHRLTRLTDHGSSATLHFENGTDVDADLVVAADGIRSPVRRQLFTTAEPVFSGEHAYRVVIDAADAHGLMTDTNPRFYMGTNGTIAYNLPLPHRGQLSYDITAPSDDDAWEPTLTRDRLLSLLDGFDERIVAVAREVDIAAMTSRSVHDIEPVDTWHTDTVTLLGDAAHAMLHHQGQGANSAIQDAQGLADAVTAADSVPSALAQYQSTRKPVTDGLQRVSRLGWNAEAIDDAFPERNAVA